MTNSNEPTPEEQKRPESELTPVAITLQAMTETDQRHYAPLHAALPNEGARYEWKRETGDIQSYQHSETAGWLHINPHGQFFDRHAQSIPKEQALANAGHITSLSAGDSHSLSKTDPRVDQGLSL